MPAQNCTVALQARSFLGRPNLMEVTEAREMANRHIVWFGYLVYKYS